MMIFIFFFVQMILNFQKKINLIMHIIEFLKKVKNQTSWVVLCVVNNGMLTEYSLIEFLE
jgi:hypothetical protein